MAIGLFAHPKKKGESIYIDDHAWLARSILHKYYAPKHCTVEHELVFL